MGRFLLTDLEALHRSSSSCILYHIHLERKKMTNPAPSTTSNRPNPTSHNPGLVRFPVGLPRPPFAPAFVAPGIPSPWPMAEDGSLEVSALVLASEITLSPAAGSSSGGAASSSTTSS